MDPIHELILEVLVFLFAFGCVLAGFGIVQFIRMVAKQLNRDGEQFRAEAQAMKAREEEAARAPTTRPAVVEKTVK
jgi:cell division protein FtsB